MSPHPSINLVQVWVSHFSFLCCFLQCCFNKSPCNSLHQKKSQPNAQQSFFCVQPFCHGKLTFRGLVCTILTACWLLKCSQRPSEAKMRNWSSGWSLCTNNDGSALRIGFWNGSCSLNLGRRGSLLNSAFFRYASPIDLEICNDKKEGINKRLKRKWFHFQFSFNV